jgi:hypothetical protein
MGITLALGAFLLFVAFMLLFQRAPAPAQLDLVGVPEADSWRFSPEGRTQKLAALRQREQAEASSVGWIDQGRGIVRLPLQQAMDLTIKEINANPKR